MFQIIRNDGHLESLTPKITEMRHPSIFLQAQKCWCFYAECNNYTRILKPNNRLMTVLVEINMTFITDLVNCLLWENHVYLKNSAITLLLFEGGNVPVWE